jgi:DNA polymerase III delta prime subunit
MFEFDPAVTIWVEKHRPRKIEDMVLTEEQMIFFNRCIKTGDIPHLLFIGSPGSGKTTLARILCDNIIKNESDIMYLNGSDDTGVENVRQNIIGFLKSPPLQSNIKVIFVDEADYLSKSAQGILRNAMETYVEIGRFIFTANYSSKIIDPLHSRFQTFEFERISEDFCLDYCRKILKEESITHNEDDVKLVIKSLYPDIRKIVNTIQRHVIDGKLKGINASTIITNEKKLIGLIIEVVNSIGSHNEKPTINKNTPAIHKLIYSGKEPEYNRIYEELILAQIPPWAKIKVNKYANDHISCAIPPIHFTAMILDIIQAGKEYYKMFGTG